MTLSKRRLQFLDQLVDLYQQRRLPIHYEALAKVVGVSKWTAYDMLKAIEKAGFVTRSYEMNPNETGRSQVVFAPTEKATALLGKSEALPEDIERGEASLQSIRDMLGRLEQASTQELIHKLLTEIPEKRLNLEACGHISGILLIYIKKLGGRTAYLIQKMVDQTLGHHARLLMFVGTVMGTIVQTMSDEIGNEFVEMVGTYMKLIDALSLAEQAILADFIREALA